MLPTFNLRCEFTTFVGERHECGKLASRRNPEVIQKESQRNPKEIQKAARFRSLFQAYIFRPVKISNKQRERESGTFLCAHQLNVDKRIILCAQLVVDYVLHSVCLARGGCEILSTLAPWPCEARRPLKCHRNRMVVCIHINARYGQRTH